MRRIRLIVDGKEMETRLGQETSAREGRRIHGVLIVCVDQHAAASILRYEVRLVVEHPVNDALKMKCRLREIVELSTAVRLQHAVEISRCIR
jgi:hypothetical protein